MVIFADKLYFWYMWPLFLGTDTPAPLMLPDSVQKANFAETVHKIANLDFETVLQNLLSESVWILLKITLALAIYFIGRWILRRIVRTWRWNTAVSIFRCGRSCATPCA